MDTAATVVRLYRRAGFGLAPGQLDAAVARGVEAEESRLLEPAGAGIASAPDAWAGVDLTFRKGHLNQSGVQLVAGWVNRMVSTPRPLEERMAWFWHGHFVSALAKVRLPLAMATQIRLFQSAGLGSFGALLRAVTTDPAMLIYLDGTTSTGAEPNENYGRELLELFTLGRGNYRESDVHAGAVALTGWQVDRARPSTSTLRPRRHDDSPQTYLGARGVHDVDSVVAAVTAQPACAAFVASKIGRELLGPNVGTDHLADLTAAFKSSGLDVRALVRAALAKLVAGVDGGPVVVAPVPWTVMALRATDAALDPRVLAAALRSAGQLPLFPPNVGGWPGGAAWLASGTVVGRLALASAIAAATPSTAPAASAARAGDIAELARALGLAAGFGAATAAALNRVRDGASRLVLGLTSPEFVLA